MRETIFKISSFVLMVIVIILSSILILNSDYYNNKKLNSSKSLINNVVVNAVNDTNLENSTEYYDNLEKNGLISKDIKDRYFNFDKALSADFWNRFDLEGSKNAVIRLNHFIGENKDGSKDFLVVISYQYPIDKEDVGHNLLSTRSDDDVYYRNNKVLVFKLDAKNKIVGLGTFPESELFTADTQGDVEGINTRDIQLFEEGRLDLNSDYVNEVLHGREEGGSDD